MKKIFTVFVAVYFLAAMSFLVFENKNVSFAQEEENSTVEETQADDNQAVEEPQQADDNDSAAPTKHLKAFIYNDRTPKIDSASPLSGTPGTIVTLTGTGLFSGTIKSVKFGDINATSFSVSTNGKTLKATAPGGSGTEAGVSINVNYQIPLCTKDCSGTIANPPTFHY